MRDKRASGIGASTGSVLTKGELVVVPNAKTLAQAAAEHFAALAQSHRPFTVALSGGSTPRPLYRKLAGEPYRDLIPWEHIVLFWGDERCVPPSHADSNYRMAREALFDHVPIPVQHVHRIQGELPPAVAAEAYQAEITALLGSPPVLDLVLLGLGADGHTASLFPGTAAVTERDRWVTAVQAKQLDVERVTLTLATLNAARHVLFLVSGSSKAVAMGRLARAESLPAGKVCPPQGKVTWLVDEAAASELRVSSDRIANEDAS